MKRDRAREILSYGMVVAFPGGRGTDDMVRRARAAGVRVVSVDADGTAEMLIEETDHG